MHHLACFNIPSFIIAYNSLLRYIHCVSQVLHKFISNHLHRGFFSELPGAQWPAPTSKRLTRWFSRARQRPAVGVSCKSPICTGLGAQGCLPLLLVQMMLVSWQVPIGIRTQGWCAYGVKFVQCRRSLLKLPRLLDGIRFGEYWWCVYFVCFMISILIIHYSRHI